MPQKTTIDSELQIKATAALRKEVISELTQPDRPMSFLTEGFDETKNNEQDCDRERDSRG